MEKDTANAGEKNWNARYRQRLREAGAREVLFQLPDETLAIIDEIKKRQRLPSRSLALLQLIERGIQAAQ
jgi:sporulation-control protein spo0M